jgi:DNA-binding transcriptional LysR family regulator
MDLSNVAMHETNDPLTPLGRMDINLLVSLDALLQLRSVTAAAKQLGVTQPAMSHALRRLREQFNDGLLVRAGGAMVLTPRAESLSRPLRAALVQLSETIAAPEPFDPGTTDRTFRMVSPDLFDLLLLPALLREMARAAPGATLSVSPGFSRASEHLATGEIDIAIAPSLLPRSSERFGPPLAPDLRLRRLVEDRFQAFVRVGHPALERRRLSVAAFARLDHVLVSPTGLGAGPADAALEAHGVARRIVLRVPTFASALAAVRESDLVIVAPGVLETQAGRMGLAVLKLPAQLTLPDHALSMVWHPRYQDDPGHAWLRALLLRVMQALNYSTANPCV